MRRISVGAIMMIVTVGSAFGQDPTPLNASEWQSAAEILSAAKLNIVEHGWQQGSAEAVTQECLSTAIEGAWKKLGKTLVDFDYAKLALSKTIGAPPTSELTAENDPLAVPYWGRYYVYWNDAPGRTMEEVVGALDGAAQYAEGQMAEAIKANRTESDVIEFDRSFMKTFSIK